MAGSKPAKKTGVAPLSRLSVTSGAYVDITLRAPPADPAVSLRVLQSAAIDCRCWM